MKTKDVSERCKKHKAPYCISCHMPRILRGFHRPPAITETERLDFMLNLPCFRRTRYSSRRSIDAALRSQKRATKDKK